jgi:hypothetical protein
MAAPRADAPARSSLIRDRRPTRLNWPRAFPPCSPPTIYANFDRYVKLFQDAFGTK